MKKLKLLAKQEMGTIMNRKSVFRSEAVKWYWETQNRPPMPKFLLLSTTKLAWVLIVILFASMFFAGTAPIPIYSHGVVCVVNSHPGGDDNQISAVMIFSPTEASWVDLQDNQPIYIKVGPSGMTVTLINIVAPELWLDGSLDSLLEGHGCFDSVLEGTQLAMATVEYLQNSPESVLIQPGEIFSAKVLVAHRQLISFFPWINRWIGTES